MLVGLQDLNRQSERSQSLQEQKRTAAEKEEVEIGRNLLTAFLLEFELLFPFSLVSVEELFPFLFLEFLQQQG